MTGAGGHYLQEAVQPLRPPCCSRLELPVSRVESSLRHVLKGHVLTGAGCCLAVMLWLAVLQVPIALTYRSPSIAGAKPAKLGRTESGNLEFTPSLGPAGPAHTSAPHTGVLSVTLQKASWILTERSAEACFVALVADLILAQQMYFSVNSC